MTTIQLPASTLEKLDYLSRNFVWGGGQHLVAWDQICSPRVEGGLGVKSPRMMNKALIAKVGWRLLNDNTSLWASVIRSKYKVGEVHDLGWQTARRTGSATWRSIQMGLPDVIAHGISWVVGNGQQILFWTDTWCAGEALVETVNHALPLGYENVTVQDLWLHGGGWDWSKISQFIPEEKRLEIMAIVVDNATGVRDRLAWRDNPKGEFTVRSAYEFLTKNEIPRPNMGQLFRCIWRLTVPERVRVFLWLVARQAIMSNAERYRRHLSNTDTCQICQGGTKTILHIIRDCPAIAGIWNRLVPLAEQQSFFSLPLFELIYRNAGETTLRGGVPWAITFALVVWWAWKWRCGDVFGDTRLWRDRLKFLQNLAKEVFKAAQREKCEDDRRSSVEVMIGWTSPQIGWMKFNTDGASRGNPGLATAGGVLRDSDGAWSVGFALNIGRCSATLAELWGVYYGLVIAWERGITRLELEVDSQIVVEFLKDGIGDSHPLSFLVRLCHGFLSRDWLVRIVHVYREANCLADSLANYAFDLPLGLHFFEFIPDVCLSSWDDDFAGRVFARQVRV